MSANTLTITRTAPNYFTAQIGGRFSASLTFDEALGVTACFVMGGGVPYLSDYAVWAAQEKRFGGYVEPAGLLPAPERHANANLEEARALLREAAGVSCPLIRASYLKKIAEALGGVEVQQ